MANNDKQANEHKSPDVDRQRERERDSYIDGLIESDDCWNIYDPESGARSFNHALALTAGPDRWSITYGEDAYDQYPYWVRDHWDAWEEYQGMLERAFAAFHRQRTLFHVWPIKARAAAVARRGKGGATPARAARGIESRVAHYLARITEMEDVRASVREAVASEHEVAALLEHAEAADSPQLFNRLLLYAPFWRRSSLDFAGGDGRALIDHLFVDFAVPEFLYQVWARDTTLTYETKWLGWFLVLAQGGSLYRYAACDTTADWYVTRAFQQHLFQAPANAPFRTACLAAEIYRIGGGGRELRRILANPAFVFDVTDRAHAERLPGIAQLHNTVGWLTRHGDAIDDRESHQLLNWAVHEMIEQRDFSWSRRSVQASLRRATQYWQEITRHSTWQPVVMTWQPHGLDWACKDEVQRHWTIREITDSRELADEGRAMRHCVSSYAYLCRNGESAIFSLRANNQRCLTLEMKPTTWRLAQARGACNRTWLEHEQRIVARWIDECIIPRTCGDAPADETAAED